MFKKNTAVAARLARLNEAAAQDKPERKLFKELKYGERFSIEPNGRIMKFNNEIAGCSSISSPTRMCYFMSGWKDETRVDGTKEDLLNREVWSYGFPGGYKAPTEDELHDQGLIDDAMSSTYRDSIIDCANRCRKPENRKLILSLLDDPDIVLEEYDKIHAEKNVSQDGYIRIWRDQIEEITRMIATDKWIEALYGHYLDNINDSEEEKLLKRLVVKEIARLIGFPEEHIEVILGSELFVIDLDIEFVPDRTNKVPAYIHITKDSHDKWTYKLFKRGR